jgi:hypothetical protein
VVVVSVEGEGEGWQDKERRGEIRRGEGEWGDRGIGDREMDEG